MLPYLPAKRYGIRQALFCLLSRPRQRGSARQTAQFPAGHQVRPEAQEIGRDHGAGLYCYETSPVVTNNVFRRNRVLEPASYNHNPSQRRQRGIDGGAIGLVNAANADIRHNLFYENETGVGYGGAIAARDDCIPVIAHNVFWGNRAGVTDKPGSASGNGGAVGLLFSSRAAVFHNLFVAN